MATERVGIDLFLKDTELKAGAKSSQQAIQQSAKGMSKGFTALSKNVRATTSEINKFSDKSRSDFNKLNKEIKNTNSQLKSLSSQSGQGLKKIGDQATITNKQLLALSRGVNKGFTQMSRSMRAQALQAQRSSRQVVSAIKSIRVQAEKTEKKAVNSFRKMRNASQKLSSSLFNVRNAFLGLGTGLAIRQGVKIADTYSLIDSRLKLVTKDTKELARVQGILLENANETRQSFESTAGLYTKIARSTKTLGLESQAVADVTETLNKALIISGAGAVSADAAIIQLTQGLQSGVLRGQEYNSVLEQTPRIAQALAEGLGLPLGELRKLADQGKLTSEVVIKALQNQAEAIDKEFKEVGKTTEQAFVVTKNVINDLINDINKSSGATDILIEGIEEFTSFIKENKSEIKEFFENAINGAKLLAPLLNGIIATTLKVAEGYARIAEALSIFQQHIAEQQTLETLRNKENKNLNEQAQLLNLLNARQLELTETLKNRRRVRGRDFLGEELRNIPNEVKKAEEAIKSAQFDIRTKGSDVETKKETVKLNQVIIAQNNELANQKKNQEESVKAQVEQFQFLKQITEEAFLVEKEGRELALAQLQLETAELQTQATTKIENAQILADTIAQINETAKIKEDLIDKEFNKKKDDRTKARIQAEIDASFQLGKALIQLQQSIFGKSKEGAIAMALINTFQGVTKAYAQGGLAGLITGGAVLTSGLAQVNNIRKQKFEFGGIVDGQTSGDTKTVKANGGEVFLNREQQLNLINGQTNNNNSGDTKVIILNPAGLFSDEMIAQQLVNIQAVADDNQLTAQG